MSKARYTHEKVTWDKTARKFRIKWEDPLAALNGENKNKKSSRKLKWKGTGKPPKEVIELEKKILEKEIEELEEELKKQAEQLQFTKDADPSSKILVWEWFSKIPDEDLTEKATATDEARRKRRRVTNAFANWAEMKQPELYLHEVRECHMKDYFTWRKANANSQQGKKVTKEYSYGTLEDEKKILRRFWKEICKNFVDSDLPYRNPLADFTTEKVVEKKMSRYDPLTADQMKSLYNSVDTAKGYTAGDYKLQLKAMVYFHIVTGWRTAQICKLKWADVDLQNRFISIIHSKTKTQGTRTILYITDKMMDILQTLKKKFAKNPLNLYPEYVFGLRKHSGGENATIAQMKAYFSAWREKNEFNKLKVEALRSIHATSIESIRCGVVQQLSLKKFNVQVVDYLVGHSNGSINSNNYLKLENEATEATKEMIEKMEELAGVTFWNEEARINSETKKQEERLKKARKNLKAGQGGFLLDIDPKTGKQVQIPL